MLNKVAFLEVEVSKWRVTACTVWRVERPKVVGATIAFVKAVRSNHQLSFKVGSVLAKLLHTRLDELFKRCKDLQEEKNNLAGRVEDVVAEKGKLAKKVADLEARAKESESMLKETELQATAEREAIKKLEDELLIFKREAMEHHEKGFNKVVR